MIQSWPFFIRFLITTACLITYLCLIIGVQWREVLKPKDWLTGLRWFILGSLSISAIALAFPAIYLFYLSLGNDSQTLRQVISLISGVHLISSTVLLVLIFTYRRRG
jgi:hypothetical protein